MIAIGTDLHQNRVYTVGLVDHLFRISAITLISVAILKAFVDFDQAWDSLAYHYPFAGLRMGLIDNTHYLPLTFQGEYDGFPVLMDWVKGILWWGTGRIEAANLVSPLSVLLLALYCWRAFRLPISTTLVAALAIPTVHVAISANYVDVPVNCMFAIVLLELFRLLRRRGVVRLSHTIFAMGLLAGVANVKPQFWPLALLAVASYMGVLVWFRYFDVDSKATSASFKLIQTTVIGCAIIFIIANPVWNIIKFGNPIYPVSLQFGPINLPGVYGTSSFAVPEYLTGVPKIVRVILSIIEYRAFDHRSILYTMGNGDVPLNAMSLKMGGFFLPLFLCTFGMLFHLSRSGQRRDAYILLTISIISLLITSFFPGAHQLRYFMFTLIVPLIGCLIILEERAATIHDKIGLIVSHRERNMFRFFLFSVLAFVTSATGAIYVWPEFRGIEYYLPAYRAILEKNLEKGKHLCIGDLTPRGILFAQIFHPDIAKRTGYVIVDILARGRGCGTDY